MMHEISNLHEQDDISDVSRLLSKLLEESDISEYERLISKIDLNNISKNL